MQEMGHKKNEFRVRWKGGDADSDDWIRAADFDTPASLVDYWRRVTPGRDRKKGKAQAKAGAKPKKRKR